MPRGWQGCAQGVQGGRNQGALCIDGCGVGESGAAEPVSIPCDLCSPVSVSAVAGVLQNPGDASLFASSSRQCGESRNGAAGEVGHQCTEVLGASKTRICSTWPLQDGHSA